MPHAPVGCDVGVGRAGRGLPKKIVDLGRGRVGHHDRTGLRIQRLDLVHAIVLFVRLGELVLADAIGVVRRDRRGCHQAGLHMAAHDQPIGVVARLTVTREHAICDHAPKIFCGFGVNLGRVRVGAGRQIDLGLGDVQKAPGLAGGLRARLVGRQHVIRWSGDIGRALWHRAQSGEGSNQMQGWSSIV